MSKDRGMTDAEIEIAMDRLVSRTQTEANKAVKRGAALYAARLKQNAPRQSNPKEGKGIYSDTRHSADNIKVTGVRNEDGRPEIDVGFLMSKGLGWYMHFPDGGTTVRGTLHQPAQNFVEKTMRETVGPIQALFRYAIKKGLSK